MKSKLRCLKNTFALSMWKRAFIVIEFVHIALFLLMITEKHRCKCTMLRTTKLLRN